MTKKQKSDPKNKVNVIKIIDLNENPRLEERKKIERIRARFC